jgi:DNA-binding NarL/FixJ family response regulator
MDVRMPVLDGLEATRRIVARDDLDGVRILVLTTFEIDEYVFDALRAGAAGFLLKDEEPAELVRAVRVVAEGRVAAVSERHPPGGGGLRRRPGAPLARARVGWKRSRSARRKSSRSPARPVEPRDRRELVISPATARTHVSRAMLKLGARDRAQLVVFAYEAGLVAPGRGVR